MTHPSDYINWGPERTTPRTAPLSALPVDTEALNLEKKQRLALSALLDRYTKSAAPTPPSGSRVFYDWLQDFGTSMQKGATEDPTLSTLGAFGQGFAGASSGVDRRSVEGSKMRSRTLQNLASEMTLLKGASELQPYKYMSPDEAVAAGFHRKDKVLRGSGNRPPKLVKAFKTTPATFERITDGIVFTVPEGSPDIEHYRRDYGKYREIGKPRAKAVQTGFATFENLDPKGKVKIKQIPLSNTAEVAKFTTDPTWLRTGAPSAKKKGAIPTGFATFENQKGTIKQIPLSNTTEVAKYTRDKEWLRVGAPSIGKKGTVPLTAENTVKGKPYAEWRDFTINAIDAGDTPVLNLESGMPSLKKPTPLKKDIKVLKAADVEKGGEYEYLADFYANRGDATPIIDSKGKPDYIKPPPKGKKWQPLIPENNPKQYEQWKDVTPPGMMTMIDMNSDPENPEIKMVPKTKLSWLTFTDPNKIYDPITLREDDTEGIDLARSRNMIKGHYQGDINAVTKSARSRWRENQANIGDGIEIIDELFRRINEDRAIAGAVGNVLTFKQAVRGMIEDFSKETGLLEKAKKHLSEATARNEIEPEALGFQSREDGPALSDWFNPNLGAVDVLENALIYKIAQSNKSSGRLNIQDLKIATAQVNVTGWTSMDNVINNLRVMKQLLGQRYNTYSGLLTRSDDLSKGDRKGSFKSDWVWDPVKGKYFKKKK
jgi:hypothetical protein